MISDLNYSWIIAAVLQNRLLNTGFLYMFENFLNNMIVTLCSFTPVEYQVKGRVRGVGCSRWAELVV